MQNRKVKICHITAVDITLKFLLLPQLKFLQKEEYDVYTVCSSGKWVDGIKKEGINIKTIKITRKISPIRDLISLWRLYFYFKKEKFDIVHTHTPKPGLLGQLAAKLAGVPIVVNTVHGLYFQKDSSIFKREFFIFIEKISALCSDLIFSQNKEDINTIVKEKISKLEKIVYLGNGVDVNKFNSERFSQEFIDNKKRQFGIKTGFKIIGAVGRLVKEKGYLDLFSAFRNVLEKFPKTLLIIVGPEDSEKKDFLDKEIVKKYGIEGNTVFFGERDDVEEIYPLMNIFVLASYREGFPRTIIEAMASQRPIITTNIRGCREAVENGITGKLVEPGNPRELSEAMMFFLKNPEEAQKFGLNARRKAEEEFNEEIVFDKIKEHYLKLLSEKIK